MKSQDSYFEEIYQKYADKVYRYIYMKCQNKELSEDVTQTTFLKAIDHADSFKNECSVMTWLCRIAQNTLLDEIKRRENKNLSLDELPLEQTETEPSGDILNAYLGRENKLNLYAGIHRLDEMQKEIVLHRLLGLSFKEIGQICNQSETWARVNFYRAKEKLKREIGDE